MSNNKKVVLSTLGDPSGIGPEIALRTFQRSSTQEKVIPAFIGSQHALQERRELLKKKGIKTPKIFEIKSLDDIDVHRQTALYVVDICPRKQITFRLGYPDKITGEIAVESIFKAIDILQQNPTLSLVTAPISKQAIQLGKYSQYKGHKEIFEERLGGIQIVNMIVNYPSIKKPLRLVHVTSHIPLRQVSEYLLSPGAVMNIVQLVNLTCVGLKKMGIYKPRVAITGFNPHLEEWGDVDRGDLGKEEKLTILPAVAKLKKCGVKIDGPFTADTAYRQARKGNFDVVVSMFHDQSHIVANSDPKGFANNIILTLGLPFLRLSTSHGLALDVAPKLKANELQFRNCFEYIQKVM